MTCGISAKEAVVARVRILDGDPYTSVRADTEAQAADVRSFKIIMEWALR